MAQALFEGFTFTPAPAITIGSLVVFRPSYRSFDTGCRVIDIKSDGSLVLKVLDAGRDFGMKFVARADQVNAAI